MNRSTEQMTIKGPKMLPSMSKLAPIWKRMSGTSEGTKPPTYLSHTSQDTNESDFSGETTPEESLIGSVTSLTNYPELMGGTLLVQSSTLYDLSQDYVLVDKDTPLSTLAKFMGQIWQLSNPKIMLSVISNHEYFIPMNDSELDDLMIGLVEVARLTDVWLFTEGLNAGISKYIGEAVMQELLKRQTTRDIQGVGGKLAVIGLVSISDLDYGDWIEKQSACVDLQQVVPIENRGNDRRELNPYHTQFMLLKGADTGDKEAQWNARFNIEARLMHCMDMLRMERSSAHEKKTQRSEDFSNAPSPTPGRDFRTSRHTPVVGILIQGGPPEIDRVLWLLKKQLPVIVLKRKGFASGLIAYAYYEGMKGGSSQHLESIVKPQLAQQVLEAFPEYCLDNDQAKLQCRDKILECVKYAVQGDRHFLTVVDPNMSQVDLKDLSKFILTAIVTSQSHGTGSREEIAWNLRLTLHWNQPKFAAQRILSGTIGSSYRVKDDLFLEALLLPNREQFVELFINNGLCLHRLLIPSRLSFLYEQSLENDFFVGICLEKVLNRKTHGFADLDFLDSPNSDLDKLLCSLTGLQKLMSSTNLVMGRKAAKTKEKLNAERKALLALIYWSVLTNRQALAKVLWKRTSEPIAVALVISNMFYRLSKLYITDVDLKKSIKRAAVQFGSLAIDVMDLTYSDSSLLAYHSLVNPLPDFNNMNVVDLALIGSNIFFIAHPCCQRSMRDRWMGHIRIKSFGRFPIQIPQYIKIMLCLVLIFPMYFWLTFDSKERNYKVLKEATKDSFTLERGHRRLSSQVKFLNKKKKAADYYVLHDPYGTPPIWRQIYFLWTAPVTKFWLNQLFMVIYLFLFGYALLIPYCGSQLLNVALAAWTMVNLIEHITWAAKRKMKFRTLSLFWPMQDIFVEMVVVFILLYEVMGANYYLSFILPKVSFVSFKLILSIGLLFTYFRALRYLLPVSQELGPMLVNITLLTRKDMLLWFRLWALCLLSGALTIQIVNYPAMPFTASVFASALLRALLGIFLTEIDDLDGDPGCSPLYQTTEVAYACNASSLNPYLLSRLQGCPYGSWVGYFMVIQYLLITRLIFYTLMFAIFSVTINKTKARSVEIWKYQFYSMVTDFEARSVVPVPLTPITYPFKILFYGGKLLILSLFGCSQCCHGIREQFKAVSKSKYTVPYNQWKSYMVTMARREAEKEMNLAELVAQLEEQGNTQRLMTRRVTDRLVDIEHNQNVMGFVLENLLYTLKALDPKAQAQKAQAQTRPIHTLSRQSPYPGTDINRFPVLENVVPWEVAFEQYDPLTYSRSIDDYPVELQAWVDPDVLKLHGTDSELSSMVGVGEESDLPPSPASPQFEPQYNAVVPIVLANGKEGKMDRTSMITMNDQPVLFEIDATGVPRNPVGRTGLRGRGNLYRWGPNHVMKAVISRWKSPSAAQTSGARGADQPGGKRMEILVSHDGPDVRASSLPSGVVNTGVSHYTVMCNMLFNLLFKEGDIDLPSNYDQEEMIQYFSQFASSEMQKKNKSTYAYHGYSAFMVYRGYHDDPSNTDNAWYETEVWNFHYKYKECFDAKIKDGDQLYWMTVTENMPLSPHDFAAALEAARLHNTILTY